MMARRTQLLVFAFKSSRTKAWLLLFSILVGVSSGFNDRLLHRSRTASAVAIATHKKRSYQQRQNPQLRNALSYPVGGPSLEQNNSWEETISQVPKSTIEHDHVTTFDKIALTASVGLSVSAVYAMLAFSSPGAWRYFLAGGVCAATSHAIPTPVDVVKTRKQVCPELADMPFLKAARNITKNEGMSALWAGLGPTAWGYLFEGAIKFGVYEVLKPLLKSSLSRAAKITSLSFLNSQILAFAFCGAVSGLAASFMLIPMEALRIRLVSEPEFAPGGWVEGGYKMFKQEGFSGLVKGMNPMVMKQVPYTVTKNVSFDIFTKFFYSIMRAQGIAFTAATTFTVPLISAAVASVLACISSQPGDMILSLVNAHEGDLRSREVYQNILRSERGFWGFFVGFKIRLLHVGIIVTLQLLIYDYVKRLFGIAATGSA